MAVRTIDEMKIGDKLVFGKYGVNNDYPEPIVWLKASRENDFLSQKAIDYLMFDEREPRSENRNIQYNGNPAFQISNLSCYLNSDQCDWYYPQHQNDEPPNTRGYINRRIASHYGFLYHFLDHEIASLVLRQYSVGDVSIQSLIRLPSVDEIMGADHLPLFNKVGIRPKATYGVTTLGFGFDDRSYISFWTRSIHQNGQRVMEIDRTGYSYGKCADDTSGIRPLCTIKGDILVTLGEDNHYSIVPYRTPDMEVCTDEQLFELLGIPK